MGEVKEAVSYRILYLGNDWYGSCARACGYALRRAGHDVIDLSLDSWVPHSKHFAAKVLMRMARPVLRAEFNETILSSVRRFSPDMLITFKGNFIDRQTLRQLRNMGLPLYQYYPDNSVFSQPLVDPRTMEEYDCCFFTKKFLIPDTTKRLKLRDSVYLPHGYDPEIHRIHEVSDSDIKLFDADVAAIMTHTVGKEEFIDELLRLKPHLHLRIWGSGWTERCKSSRVKSRVEGAPLYGQAYVKAIKIAKINLALLMEPTKGASDGDLTTTRTFEIPACGGFMLHKRTTDVKELFKEGLEIACFDSPTEAAEKIEFYLADESERQRILRNGRDRAVPNHSYDARMEAILRYHETKKARLLEQGVIQASHA